MKKVFFASDFHLGAQGTLSSPERERRIVRWLDHIAPQAEAVYLVGDVFDFWFEYKHAIPRGFLRLQGKLAELSDAGIALHLFTGNHDMWMFDYFKEELKAHIHRAPVQHSYFGKRLFIGHGDGLGPGDKGYKRLKKVFANPLCQWAFARLHPNFGIGLAQAMSKKSRSSQPPEDEFLGPDGEWLIQYAERKLKTLPDVDYFIFGHRHLPISYLLSNGRTRYINLGEWLHYCSYLELGPDGAQLRFFERPDDSLVFG